MRISLGKSWQIQHHTGDVCTRPDLKKADLDGVCTLSRGCWAWSIDCCILSIASSRGPKNLFGVCTRRLVGTVWKTGLFLEVSPSQLEEDHCSPHDEGRFGGSCGISDGQTGEDIQVIGPDPSTFAPLSPALTRSTRSHPLRRHSLRWIRKDLDHPNICRLLEVYQTPGHQRA